MKTSLLFFTRGFLRILSIVSRFGKAPAIAANVSQGIHAGHVTYLADGAIAAKHLFVEVGSDASHVAVCNAATDIPLGVVTDEAPAAEDPVNVALLGSASTTLRAKAGANISAGAFLTTADDGEAVALPTAAGTYYIVGRAITAASAGELVEFDPCLPIQRIVTE